MITLHDIYLLNSNVFDTSSYGRARYIEYLNSYAKQLKPCQCKAKFKKVGVRYGYNVVYCEKCYTVKKLSK